MKLRTLLAGAVTLLVASQGMAVLKTYTADGDQSTKFPTDRRVYRGDCDPDAATPNAGDDQALGDDQCKCTPGVNCTAGAVPIPLICNIASPFMKLGVNCTVDADCTPGLCLAGSAATGVAGDNCLSSTGRPNGGACDPSIPSGAGSCPPGFPTHGSPEPPCQLTTGGSIVIDDSGNGTPTLTSLVLMAEFDDFVGASTITAIPGSTVGLHAENTLGPAPNQTGAGNTGSTINWGSLTGWTQTGRLFCKTTCPGGCGAASGCIPFVGFDGLGPPAPLSSASFNTDPWVFTGDEFTSAPFQIVSLSLGAVTAAIQVGGRLVAIPALPLAALGGLGAGLVYLGARALSRKRN